MIYCQQQPHQNLKDCVRCYWKFENTGQRPLDYTIMPDGFFDLLIYYHGNKLERVCITGLWTQKVNINILPNTTIYGIQFRLLAVEKLIHDSIATNLNNIKTLEKTFWGIDSIAKNNDSDFFEYFNKYLLAAIDKKSTVDSKKCNLLKLINQSKGNHTVDYYSKQSFFSTRQLNRYFQSTFGLSLKSYCTIRKAAASFSHIKNGQLSPNQNYFDQSHFIKEIKKITGCTPKELSKNEDGRFLQFSIIKCK